MTTFHELLGTDDTMSVDEVKKRYKFISMRVHPDKGGSSAMMQMVSQAYTFISRGEGNKEVFTSVKVDNDQTAALMNKVKLLERENRLIKEAFEKAKRQIESLNREIKETTDSQFRQQRFQTKDLSDARDEVRRLTALLAEADVKLQHARILQNANKEMNKTAGNNGSYGSSEGRRRQRWLFQAIGVAFILGLVVNIPGMKQWVSARLKGEDKAAAPIVYQVVPEAPVVESLPVSPVVDKPAESASSNLGENYDIEDNYAIDNWHNARYRVSGDAYMAVKNVDGSYIVRDCADQFYLFLNRVNEPLRVPPNLVYRNRSQSYHIYAIEYGMGSTSETWLESNRLTINGEPFVNANFASALNRHNLECLMAQ
uniref:J domain-containing protein n=1 Tax=Thaumasiovibrio occultus TaxID=1891184 RepID=UPI000B35132E|nr:J domain-containing protein [Thaumasiovibrio occultus]